MLLSLKRALLVLLSSSSSLAFAASISSAPKVKLGSGVAIGSTVDGIDSWRGIPYAQNPIADLRLLPPKPDSGFSGKRYFVKDPDSCFNVNSTAQPPSSLTALQGGELVGLLGQVAVSPRGTRELRILASILIVSSSLMLSLSFFPIFSYTQTTEAQKVASANNENSTATQSEDCLKLNVYRPTGTHSHAKLPVVVWVYGGSFSSGDITRYRP